MKYRYLPSRKISPCWLCCVFFALHSIHPGVNTLPVATDNDASETATTTTMEKNVAVVTILTTREYIPGVEVLAESLRSVDAIGDRVLLYVFPEEDDRSDLSEQDITNLIDAGWNVPIRLTKESGLLSLCKINNEALKDEINSRVELQGMKRYWGTCNKFAVWSLTDYDAVVYIDADSVVLNNFDHLYDYLIPDSHNKDGSTLFAHGVPDCFEGKDDEETTKLQEERQPLNCDKFYTALMLIKPMYHIFQFLQSISENHDVYEGDIQVLNEFYKSWKPLPRYTLVAQTETARPFVKVPGSESSGDEGTVEVNWSRVNVYDFAGDLTNKPWRTYDLQKEKGDRFAHATLRDIQPDSVSFRMYMYPQWIWNNHYDAVLARKKTKEGQECLSSSPQCTLV